MTASKAGEDHIGTKLAAMKKKKDLSDILVLKIVDLSTRASRR